MKRIIPHYVYTLTNSLTGNVFYVGKGHSTKRMSNHEWEAKKGVDSYKCRVIRKIWRQGGTVIKSKVAEFETANDALIYEWFLINLVYGIENLTNASEGGQGPNGYERTPEHIEANRIRGIERMADPKNRAFISQINKGKKMTPEQVERWRQSIEQVYTPEKCQKHSEDKKQWWQSEEGLKLREQYSQRAQNPDVRKQLGIPNIGNTYNAKTYIGFVSPSGEVFKDICNLKLFCEDHHLTYSKMIGVNTGKYKQNNGWRKYDPDKIPEPFNVPSYTYSFVSPSGIVYTDLHNLAQFCREHNLDKANMHRLVQGKQRQYNGWTLFTSQAKVSPSPVQNPRETSLLLEARQIQQLKLFD